MARLSGLLALALWVGACSDSTRIEVTYEVGDWIVYGSEINPMLGAVQASGGPISIERPASDSFHYVRVARENYRDRSGQELADPLWSQMQFTEEGGCGRCLLPNRSGPQLLRAGDRCRVTRDATVYSGDGLLEGEAADKVRDRIRIAFPGDCPCAGSNGSFSGGQLSLETIYPRVDAAPMPLGTRSPDGMTYLLGAQTITTVAPDGARRVSSWDQNGVFDEIPLAVQALDDGTLVVAHSVPEDDASAWSRTELLWLSAELTVLDRLTLELADVSQLYPLGSRLLVAGWVRGHFASDAPALLSCEIDSRIHCSAISPPRTYDLASFERVAVLESGVVVVKNNDGEEFYVLARIPPPDTVLSADYTERYAGTVQTTEGPVPFKVILSGTPEVDGLVLGPLGDRLLTCAVFGTESRVQVTRFSAELEPSKELDVCLGAVSCVGMTPTESGATVHFRDGRRMKVPRDASGVFGCDGPTPWMEAATSTVTLAYVARDGLAKDIWGRWWDRTDTSTSALLYGDPALKSSKIPVTRPDGVWVVDSKSMERLLSGEVRALPVTLDGEPNKTAFEAETGRTLVTTQTSVYIFDLDLRLLDQSHLPGHASWALALDQGRFLLVGRNEFWVWDGKWEELPLNYDDPRTASVEHRPEGCNLFEAADSTGGTAWAVGCDGIVIRVVPSEHGLRSERVAFLGRYHTGLVQRELGAVRALCPDQAFVATDSGVPGAEAWVWKLTGDNLAAQQLPSGPSMRFDASLPSDVLVTSKGWMTVHAKSRSYVHGLSPGVETQRRVYADNLAERAVTPDGAVYSTSTGRIVRVELE